MRLFVPSVAVPDGAVHMVERLRGKRISPTHRRTQKVRVFGGLAAPPHERLTSAWLSCQKGGKLHEARVCLGCNHYLRHTFSDDGQCVAVSCDWDGTEKVEAVMTDASVLVSVPQEMMCGDAIGVGRRFGVRHLLVMEHSRLAGIACLVDLRGPDARSTPVSERMVAEPWAIRPRASLSEAATLMHNLHVGFFPVVDCGRVVGVLTRGDLRRCGFEESVLGAHACDSCGTFKEVRVHPAAAAIMLCPTCLDAGRDPPGDELLELTR